MYFSDIWHEAMTKIPFLQINMKEARLGELICSVQGD